MATTKKFRVKHGLDASNNTISNVATPQSATDAANRQYVLDQVQSGVGGIANTSTSSVTWTKANNTLEFTRADSSTFDVVLTDVGEVSNAYLTSTFTTNTDFQSFVANTNAYIATKTDDTVALDTNTAIRALLSSTYATNTEFRSYVDTSVAALVNSAPTTLNTLDELASALGDDPNLSTTLTTLIGTKASNTYVNTLLANTNAYIAQVDSDLTDANVRIDTLVSDLDAQELKQAQDLANTNAYIATVSGAQSQYLQVANVAGYIPANTSTSSASYDLANSTLTFTRADSSTFDVIIDSASVEVSNTAPSGANEGDMWWDNASGELYIYYSNNWVEAVAQDVTPYANNGSYDAGNNTITIVRTDGSKFDVQLSGVGEVSNAYLTSTFTTNTVFQSFVANTNSYIATVSGDQAQYLQVANVAGYGFATENYVDTSVAALVNAAPTTLNTLDELAQALGDDQNFATTVTTTLGTKASNTYVNTLLANTNAYIASVSDAQSQYLQVANVVSSTNTSTSSATYTVANATLTFTRADSSTFDVVIDSASVEVSNTAPSGANEGDMWWDNASGELYIYYSNNWVEAVAQDVTPYANNGTFSASNNTITFVRTDGSQFDVVLTGVGEVTNAYVTSTFTTNTDFQSFVANTNSYIATVSGDQSQYLQVANSTAFLEQSDVDQYLQVANVSSYGFATETYVDTSVAALVNSAPTTLNTLDELATALGDDANFSTTVLSLIGTKASNATLTSTYVTNTTFQSTIADYWPSANVINYTAKYLEVANVESSSISVSNTAPSGAEEGNLWWDNSTGELYVYYSNNWVEAVPQDVTPYTNNASYTTGNTTLTFVRTDGSQYEVALDLSNLGGGDVTNTYLQTQLSQYLEVANSTNFLVQADVDQYLQVANVSSYGFATESYVDTSVASLVNAAPTTLNTLDELASALGDDANFATSVTTTLGTKASNTYVNTLLANTNAYIASVSDAQSQYLEVANIAGYIPANTSTSSASLSGNTVTFTRADTTTFDLDLSGLSTGGGGASLEVGNSAPFSPSEGDLWYDTDTGIINVYYGSVWVESTVAFPDAVVAFSNTAPTALEGKLWYDTDTSRLFGYYGSAWVQIAEPFGSSGGTVDQYLQVANVSQYIPANTSTTSAVLSGNTATFTRADSSTFDLDLSGLSTGGGASVTVANTVPSSPSEGDLYFDEDLGTLFIYYDSSWVEVQSPFTATTPLTYNIDTYTANGTATAFGHTSDIVGPDAMLVTVDGIVQRPTTDYIVSGNTVTFGTAPSDTSVVAIRVTTGSFTGISNTEFQSYVANTNSRLDTLESSSSSYLEITSNTTMTAGTKYIVGTRSANVVLTFPTSASLGDEVRVIDGTGQANTFGIELNRNGHRIQGQLANVIIDVSRAAGGYVYYNANNGWILTEV